MIARGVAYAPPDDAGAAAAAGDDGAADADAAAAGAAAAALVGKDGAGEATAADGAGWRGVLPDDLRDNPILARYDGVPAVAKALVEANAAISRKGVVVPGDDATQEQIDEFHAALGRPEKPEDYKISIPEGYTQTDADKAIQAAMVPEFHKLGFTARQVEGLTEAYNTATMKLMEDAAAAEKTASDEALGKLKTEWGDKYDENLALAQRAGVAFGAAENADKLESLMGTAELIKFFHNIGARMGDAGALPGGVAGAGVFATPEAAKAEITKIRNEAHGEPKHPLNDKKHPEHAALHQRLADLYKVASPEGIVQS